MIARTNSDHSATCWCELSSARYMTAPRSTTLATFQTALRLEKTTAQPGRNAEKWSAPSLAASSWLIVAHLRQLAKLAASGKIAYPRPSPASVGGSWQGLSQFESLVQFDPRKLRPCRGRGHGRVGILNIDN